MTVLHIAVISLEQMCWMSEAEKRQSPKASPVVGVAQMENERLKLFIKKENGSITEKSHHCVYCLQGKLMQREGN